MDIALLKASIEKFHNNIDNIENHRYRSWEHCYAIFLKARENRNSQDIDNLCLHLSFYLASWGMYRGSSFLLQRDYKIHEPAVKEILDEKYDVLLGISCIDLKKEISLCMELSNFLKTYYKKVRFQVKGKECNSDVSDTLITKILMGTLGCVPAYDRFFISGIREYGIASGSFSKISIDGIINFYIKNSDWLEEIRNNLKINDNDRKIDYPQMKVIDMAFWQAGYDIEETKRREKK